MKVGILNLQQTRFNYGALLQAAALEHYVRDNTGAEVEHINYIPPKAAPKKYSLLFRAKWKICGLIGRAFGRNKGGHAVALTEIGRAEVFEEFRKKWMVRTEKATSLDELAAISTDYDVGVVGSDQVWRLLYTLHTFPAFFLSFLPEHCRRIAYAASFGTDQWEGDEVITEKTASLLRKFSAISVREKSGLAICQKEFGLSVEHVLDPTLLIGRAFFDKIINDQAPAVADNDFVYYKLRDGFCGYDDVEKLVIGQCSSIENIYYRCEQADSGETLYSYHSVAEWLGKIRAAKRMLITDSFHGICFAILFEKDFVWIPNESAGTSRLESLLGFLGLADRKCTSLAEMKRMLKIEMSIDYVPVNVKLDQMRTTSRAFLLNALSK